MSLLNRLKDNKSTDSAPADSPSQPVSVPTVEAVREVIRQNVHDPEIGLNIVDMGLVYDVQVRDEKIVDVDMTLTSPGCPVGPQIIRGVQTYINQAYPDLDEINVHIVWTPMWSPDMMTQEAKDQLGFF
jgi:metal-sulfur cluster biosynthetic enzyme